MNETWWVTKDDLSDEQLEVIDLPLAGSYLILGPPGSGKTNLLLLRANYLHLSQVTNIAAIVFTRTLQEFIQGGAASYDFPTEKVRTSTKWMIDVLLEYGRKVPSDERFEDLRKSLVNEMEDLIATKGLSNIFDVILLDEAQDYNERELKLYRTLAKELFICADAKQKIYPGSDTASLLSSFVKSKHLLVHHFRNGLKICKVADEIGKGVEGYVALVPTSNYDEDSRPSTVEAHCCDDLPQQLSLLMGKLDLQRKAYPDEIIGICCPTNKDVDVVWEAIQDSPFAEVAIVQKSDSHATFGSNVKICVSTIHSAKGLEFRALHLMGMDWLKSFEFQRNIAYTAVTRAKTSLSIYYTRRLLTFLDSAIQTLHPLTKLPEVADAFGKGLKK